MALNAPTIFVLAPTVLQIKDRVTLGGVLIITGRGINESTPLGAGTFGVKENLAQLPVRHIFKRIRILVLSRNFDRASPTHRAEEHHAVWIRNFGAIDFDGVIVEPFVQRPGV